MKDTLKKLLPSWLIQLVIMFKRRSVIYPDFYSAEQKSSGYNNQAISKIVGMKTEIFKAELKAGCAVDYADLRILGSLVSLSNQEKITIIDFGGACGSHYFIARKLIPNSVELDWRVVELPNMVKQGKLVNNDTPELRFFTDLSNAFSETEKIDLVLASSSIHYCPEPYHVVEKLMEIKPEVLHICRTACSKDTVVLLQRSRLHDQGIGVASMDTKIPNTYIKYPVTILSKSKLEDILRTSYQIVCTVKEERGEYSSRHGSYDLFGYVCKRL